MLKDFFKKKQFCLFALLGILNAIPFTFEYAFFISWFALVPVFLMLIKNNDQKMPLKKQFLYIFTFFFFYHFGIYYFFMALVPMDFVGMGLISSFVVLLFAWCFLSALHAVVIAIAYIGVIKLKISNTNKIIAFALSFVIIQFLQSFGTYGFTWSRISLPQSALLPLIQSASLLGPYFVDLLLVLVNAFIAIGFYTKKYSIWISAGIAVFFANFMFGFLYMQKDIETTSDKNIIIVQGNVLSGEKWNSSSSYSTYLKKSLQIEDSNSLVVWAETAVPTVLNTSQKILSELEAYTLLSGNDLLVGAFYADENLDEKNASYLISNSKTSDNVYCKRKLVPFGEFLPLRTFLESVPFLDGINLYSSDLTPGKASAVFQTNYGNFGTLICFDSIFPYLARRSTADGAQLLVVMTNDSWYKDFPAVYQHNNQSKWRAVENGRYIVRCANSGVSSFITPNGEVLSSLPPLVQGTLSENVGFISENTLYTMIGDVIIIPVLIVIFFYVLLTIKASAFQRKLINENISSDKSES